MISQTVFKFIYICDIPVYFFNLKTKFALKLWLFLNMLTGQCGLYYNEVLLSAFPNYVYHICSWIKSMSVSYFYVCSGPKAPAPRQLFFFPPTHYTSKGKYYILKSTFSRLSKPWSILTHHLEDLLPFRNLSTHQSDTHAKALRLREVFSPLF